MLARLCTSPLSAKPVKCALALNVTAEYYIPRYEVPIPSSLGRGIDRATKERGYTKRGRGEGERGSKVWYNNRRCRNLGSSEVCIGDDAFVTSSVKNSCFPSFGGGRRHHSGIQPAFRSDVTDGSREDPITLFEMQTIDEQHATRYLVNTLRLGCCTSFLQSFKELLERGAMPSRMHDAARAAQ